MPSTGAYFFWQNVASFFVHALQVSIGIDSRTIFEGADWALLIGAKPRGPGMERRDLLASIAAPAASELSERDNEIYAPSNEATWSSHLPRRRGIRISPSDSYFINRDVLAACVIRTGSQRPDFRGARKGAE